MVTLVVAVTGVLVELVLVNISLFLLLPLRRLFFRVILVRLNFSVVVHSEHRILLLQGDDRRLPIYQPRPSTAIVELQDR